MGWEHRGDPRELQLRSAAKRKANGPRRRIDILIRKLADQESEFTGAQVAALAAMVSRRTRGDRE